MQKLSHALNILSETEKQLRMLKHQTTWLTVALLLLSSVKSSSDQNDSKLCLRSAHNKDGDSQCTISPRESFKHLVPYLCDDNQANKFGACEDYKGKLESIWQRATELCQSNSLKSFLRKQGKLSSLHVNQVAKLEFHHRDYVSRAEKSWELIASSLQSNCTKVKKPSFSLFTCSRRVQQKSQSITERGSGSDYSDYFSEKPMIKDRHTLTCSSDRGSHMSRNCCQRTEVIRALRNSEGCVLISTGTASSHRSIQDDTSKAPGCGVSSVNRNDCKCQVLSTQEPETQPSCFRKTLRLQKKLSTSDTSEIVSASNKLALSIAKKTSFDTSVRQLK